jgi:glutamine cyclotransferase
MLLGWKYLKHGFTAVLEELPHDSNAFTQGLEYLPEGKFIEGTGMNSRLVR